MDISIFGLGYVGCVCMGCFARNGHKVIGVDINKLKVEHINSGISVIIENRIDKIIGLHFFYPVKYKNIAELIITKYTQTNTINSIKNFLKQPYLKKI